MAHRPYGDVLEIIRSFQIQPRTSLALNTGQPGTLRDATLAASTSSVARPYARSPSIFGVATVLVDQGLAAVGAVT